MDKIDFYFKVLARYDQYVQLANTKASNQITFMSSILLAITALVGWGINFEKITALTSVIGFLYLIFLFFCYQWYTHCIAVIQPNRTRSSTNDTAVTVNNLSTIFYSDVAKFTSVEIIKETVKNKDPDSHLEDLINQVYIMAKVTEKKFDDYEKVKSWLSSAIVVSIIILFLTCVSKIN